MRLFKDAKYRFIEARKKAYVLSAAVLLVGVGAMVINFATLGSWQVYGVDFTGGSLIQVRFDAPMTAGDLRDALGGAQAPPITRFGEENEFVIRAALGEEEVDVVRAMIDENLVRRQEQTAHAEAMIGAEVDEFVVWQRSRGSIPTLVALRRRFEAVRESELDRLAPKLNGLSPDARARLEEVTRLLVQKLLLTPTERLKNTADEETAAQYVEALTQLFSLSEPHPADNPSRTEDVDDAGSSDTTQASTSKTPVTS